MMFSIFSIVYSRIFFFFFFAVLGLELRAFTLSHPAYFCEGFFEIRFCELFAWAGVKP
jgi:hypothetical protein